MPNWLDAKYEQESGTVYLTGIQALVRLPIDQMRRDRRAGLNTAAYISGYEGSPLGGYDLALQRVGRLLQQHQVVFQPGLNEELAATAIFGTQIAHVMGDARFDGVLGIWYGKGPGVDRSGDILRHGNLAGTGPHSAVLVLGGDDHVSKSSTIPHQSDLSFFNYNLPVLAPGNTQEILDYGLLGVALSRYCGAWTAMKLVTTVCDGGGTVAVDPALPLVRLPEGYAKRQDHRLVIPYTIQMEPEANIRRLEAARAFARLNGLNQWFGAGDGARIGIAAAGKPYYDLMQALADLGIRRGELAAHGIRIAKFGMTFPLEPEFVRDFARGLPLLLVVEEKRSFLELQLRDTLYNYAQRPVIIGKQDAEGRPLFPPVGELGPEKVARVLASLLGAGSDRVRTLDEIESRETALMPSRPPNFCSGCPHNRSTLLLPGQVGGGGIGCHGMAGLLPHLADNYAFFTQMGAEGAPWTGMSPFVKRQHIFQNIGDGSYAHSGSLALQAAIAAGVNITYKILYNGVVAMTGGQTAAGTLPPAAITRKLEAEGVVETVLVTEDLDRYDGVELARNCTLRHRDELPEVLRALERVTGVTVILYDQACAAETRRLRSRGKKAEPTLRLVINEDVCEGCGDCVTHSNCMSLHPVETEYGPKTRIHQSSCNKDYSCLLGDCPSFVTVRIKEGTGLRRRAVPALPAAGVPEPRQMVKAGDTYSILAPGIGGTGVVTVGALLATAAWIDGLSVITLDQTGLAQKGGAVLSSIILSERPIEASARIGVGNADLLLGFDLLGAADAENLKRAHPGRTVAVVNTAEIPTAGAVRRTIRLAGPGAAVDLINRYTRPGHNVFVDANRLAEALFSSHLAANIFLLGTAWQAGLIPISGAALEEAIRLNGVEADRNLQAFLWGRKYYHDAASVEAVAAPRPAEAQPTGTLLERRAADLEVYQNRAYADEYRSFAGSVAQRQPLLAEPVARYLYKLMAYKDEYEVARLLTRPPFARQVEEMWQEPEAIEYNLHPPMLRALGWKKKLRLGPWFRTPLRVLAALKGLRGTRFDIFGYAAARREERALIGWYRDLVTRTLDRVTPETLPLALELVSLPDRIRGYEDVKRESIRATKAAAEEVWVRYHRPEHAAAPRP